MGKGCAGVPGGPIVSRITIEVEVVGSNPTASFSQMDKPKPRERELAKFDENRRAPKKKLKSGNVDPETR